MYEFSKQKEIEKLQYQMVWILWLFSVKGYTSDMIDEAILKGRKDGLL